MKTNEIKKIQEAATAYIREKNFHLTEDEVYESLKLTIEGAFDKYNKKVIFDIESMSVIELTDNGMEKRSIDWIFNHINRNAFLMSVNEHLERYEREKVFNMFKVSQGQIIKAEALGETFHLGSRSNDLYPSWGYAGSVADFGLKKGIYVEGGKDAFMKIPRKDWKLWNLAKEIYDQTGYCMSINPHKKNLRLKKQPLAVIFNINGADGIMPSDERIQGEEYEGREWEVILYDINQTCREEFQLYVSRRQIEFLLQYLRIHIPGFNNFVKVKKVAREPGVMAKILFEKVDSSFRLSKYKDALYALGAKLKGERIEFVQKNGDLEAFIRSALNYEEGSLKISAVNKTALAITDKKSKIIGKKGVNVKLAGMLTDYKITVVSVDEYINDERVFASG